MQYSKTFAFLLVAILGWLGVSNLFTEGEITIVIDNIVQVVGIIGAGWARYKSTGEPVTVLGFKK